MENQVPNKEYTFSISSVYIGTFIKIYFPKRLTNVNKFGINYIMSFDSNGTNLQIKNKLRKKPCIYIETLEYIFKQFSSNVEIIL